MKFCREKRKFRWKAFKTKKKDKHFQAFDQNEAFDFVFTTNTVCLA